MSVCKMSVYYILYGCCSVIKALVFNVEFRSLDPDRVVSSKESSSGATGGDSHPLDLSGLDSVGAGDGGLGCFSSQQLPPGHLVSVYPSGPAW